MSLVCQTEDSRDGCVQLGKLTIHSHHSIKQHLRTSQAVDKFTRSRIAAVRRPFYLFSVALNV
eukprot:scaffold25555_cov20-Prasinocladus_malaysianus.AAC.1